MTEPVRVFDECPCRKWTVIAETDGNGQTVIKWVKGKELEEIK